MPFYRTFPLNIAFLAVQKSAVVALSDACFKLKCRIGYRVMIIIPEITTNRNNPIYTMGRVWRVDSKHVCRGPI